MKSTYRELVRQGFGFTDLNYTAVFSYDAAGRLVREGDKTYRYGYLDKVLSVTDGKRSYRYAYHVDGQLARADYGDGGRAGSPLPAGSEAFHWDGLALVRRGDESFVNEPHAGDAPKKLRSRGKPRAKRSARRARKGPRGNPVVSSKGTAYFNDVLGTTLGVKTKQGRKYSAAAMTAFGAGDAAYFTGKPQIPGLGRAFLFRNYRPDLGKWQTADPLGYPDGWNPLAYCRCLPYCAVDYGGAFLLVCHDYNLVGFAVHSASELSVGHVGVDASGGVFAVYLEDVQITSSGAVYIDLRLNLSIGSDIRYDSEFQSGEISEYGEHTGSQNDSYGDNMTWESVYAHEKGHADVFFSSEIALIRTILSSSNIDDGSRTRNQIVTIVRNAIAMAGDYYSERSNDSANKATEEWYANQRRWRLLESLDDGRIKSWIKE